MVSGDCTSLFEQVILMRRSCFDTDFVSLIKLTKLPLIHCFASWLFRCRTQSWISGITDRISNTAAGNEWEHNPKPKVPESLFRELYIFKIQLSLLEAISLESRKRKFSIILPSTIQIISLWTQQFTLVLHFGSVGGGFRAEVVIDYYCILILNSQLCQWGRGWIFVISNLKSFISEMSKNWDQNGNFQIWDDQSILQNGTSRGELFHCSFHDGKDNLKLILVFRPEPYSVRSGNIV